VDHGIEPPSERRRLDKGEHGSIQLEAVVEDGELVISVVDDGRGLDLEAVRVQAVERGYLTAAELAEVDDADIRDLLFSPGFSTAPLVTEVSGRGMGLNVVKTLITRMGGSVEVESDPGRGCRVRLRLPVRTHGRRLQFGTRGEVEDSPPME
jgi:two-component system chemotaxis sensor kinase CheA